MAWDLLSHLTCFVGDRQYVISQGMFRSLLIRIGSSSGTTVNVFIRETMLVRSLNNHEEAQSHYYIEIKNND